MIDDESGVYEEIERFNAVIPEESRSLRIEFLTICNMMDQGMTFSRLYRYPNEREELLKALFSGNNRVWLKNGELGTRENLIKMLNDLPPGDYDTDGRHVMEGGRLRWLCRLNHTDSKDYPKAVAFGYPSKDW